MALHRHHRLVPAVFCAILLWSGIKEPGIVPMSPPRLPSQDLAVYYENSSKQSTDSCIPRGLTLAFRTGVYFFHDCGNPIDREHDRECLVGSPPSRTFSPDLFPGTLIWMEWAMFVLQ